MLAMYAPVPQPHSQQEAIKIKVRVTRPLDPAKDKDTENGVYTLKGSAHTPNCPLWKTLAQA